MESVLITSIREIVLNCRSKLHFGYRYLQNDQFLTLNRAKTTYMCLLTHVIKNKTDQNKIYEEHRNYI